jgi:hypothetical protein
VWVWASWSSSRPSRHPLSLSAVSHRRGGGCSIILHRCQVLPVVVLALRVCIAVTPHSWGWRQVVCRVGGAGACGVCHRRVVVVGPGAVPRRGGALVPVPHRRQCLLSFTHPTQPASRCLQWWAWVVVSIFCSGGVCAHQRDVACIWGLLGAYWMGIPLLGSPGIPLHPPSRCQQPHIPFERGGGGLGGCACALRVFRCCLLLSAGNSRRSVRKYASLGNNTTTLLSDWKGYRRM